MKLLRSPAADEAIPDPPLNQSGERYRFEMIFDNGHQRAYADSHTELVGALIKGYGTLGSTAARDKARIVAMVGFQVQLQAEFCYLGRVSDDDSEILLSSKAKPPTVTTWESDVPLVLVTAFYDPYTNRVRPKEVGKGQLIWLDPRDELTFIESLNTAGTVSLAENDPDEIETDFLDRFKNRTERPWPDGKDKP